MGFKYKIPITSTALSTANNLLTVIPASTRAVRVCEVYLAGLGTASSANEAALYRISTAGTGTAPTAITPNPNNPSAPAFAGTASTGAYGTTQPTLGAKLLTIPINANGGVFPYRAARNDNELEFQAASLGFGIRSVSGTGNVAGWVEVEEI